MLLDALFVHRCRVKGCVAVDDLFCASKLKNEETKALFWRRIPTATEALISKIKAVDMFMNDRQQMTADGWLSGFFGRRLPKSVLECSRRDIKSDTYSSRGSQLASSGQGISSGVGIFQGSTP
jgi:hypothetical protein